VSFAFIVLDSLVTPLGLARMFSATASNFQQGPKGVEPGCPKQSGSKIRTLLSPCEHDSVGAGATQPGAAGAG
jgi:hypothetical protein